MFSSLLVPLTLCLLGPMVEENGSFLNDDEENEENKNEENGRRLFIDLFSEKNTQLRDQS
jgi:hypothetical protein